MKRRFDMTLGVLALSFVTALPLAAKIYNASGIAAIAAGRDGETYIRLTGPVIYGNCGNNNNWVAIPPTASPSMKSLAESLYLSSPPKPVRVDTEGCFGTYERVVALYSPGG
jgi:hypothetical protein